MSTDKERFHTLQEGYDQMIVAKNKLKMEMFTIVRKRVSALGEGCISISLVVLERHDVSVVPGNLVQYVEMDRLMLFENGDIQLTGFEEGTDDIITLALEELNIHELYKLMNILFGEPGKAFDMIPLDEVS